MFLCISIESVVFLELNMIMRAGHRGSSRRLSSRPSSRSRCSPASAAAAPRRPASGERASDALEDCHVRVIFTLHIVI